MTPIFKFMFMKKVLFLATIILFIGAFGCKKAVEDIKRNYVIDIMTNGRWYVEQFKEGSTEVTADFAGYEFQFYENGKVDGIKNTTTQQGTWAADVSALTITSNFPSAVAPLQKLNAVWKLTDSYPDLVVAQTVVGADTHYLKLRKKP